MCLCVHVHVCEYVYLCVYMHLYEYMSMYICIHIKLGEICISIDKNVHKIACQKYQIECWIDKYKIQ